MLGLRAFGLLFWVLRCLVEFGVCWRRFLGACFWFVDLPRLRLLGVVLFLLGCGFVGYCDLLFLTFAVACGLFCVV